MYVTINVGVATSNLDGYTLRQDWSAKIYRGIMYINRTWVRGRMVTAGSKTEVG